jgi:type I restriction enzyme M protein
MNPQKFESVLDPACGTAGFLISAWKHILASNTTPSSDGKNNSKLSNGYEGRSQL